MSSYFLSLLLLVTTGLFVTIFGGVLHKPWHLTIALPSAILVVGMHSLVIIFVLIGTRLLREAVNNCGLDPEYMRRGNAYFKHINGLYLNVAGAFSMVTAAVLGYGHRGFGLSPNVHLIIGLIAAVTTFVSIPFGFRYLREIERLLDGTRKVLDAEDKLRADNGMGPVDEEYVAYRDPISHKAKFIIIAPICVYLYQLLIVWRGDFGRVSLHPWIEISAVGLFLWLRVRGKPESDPQD
ncbi:MAG: hypothetical protein ACI8X5_000138 [Planctomycetota bacterium]|jgi:hypothetical protein